MLLKYSLPNSQWIETGTYLGHTTQFLAKIAPKVYTVEPSEQLHKNAKQALKSVPQIECILASLIHDGAVAGYSAPALLQWA